MSDDNLDIPYKVSVDTDPGQKSLKQLREEFKDFDNKLNNSKKGTKEFTDALKGMGEAKGKIIELKTQIDALNPEARGRAIGQISNSLAGGFQAATGAAALFGAKAEDVQKVLLRVQAATALAQGIQEVTQLGSAFTALKLILLANPIFAIAAVITAVAVAVYELTGNVKEESEEFKRAKDSIDKYALSHREAKKSIEDLKDELLVENGVLTQAAADKNKIQRDRDEQLIKQNEEYEKEKKNITDKASKDYISDEIERETTLTNLKIAYDIKRKDIIDQAELTFSVSRKQAINKELDEQDNKFNKLEEKQSESLIKIAEKRKASEEKEGEERVKRIHEQISGNAEYDKLQEQKLIDHQTELDEMRKMDEANDALTLADKKQTLANELKLKEELKQREFQLEQQAFQSITHLSATLFANKLIHAKGNAKEELKIKKEEFRINKSLNAAQTAMNTATAIMKIISQGGLYATPLAIATGVLGAVEEAAILATQFDSGGSSIGTISNPTNGGNVSAPQIESPQQPSVFRTKINKNEEGDFVGFNKPIKAYVVETEITDSQKSIKRIENNAKY